MESSPSEKGRRLSKTWHPQCCCCGPKLCWCCCSGCLRSQTVRRRRRHRFGHKTSSVSQLEIPPPLEERLTLEEASSWKHSFDCVLASPAGQSIFMEFLQTEHSDENMAFWLAYEELKREQSQEQVCEKAKMIYLDYITILSPKEVGQHRCERESVNRSLARPSAHMCNEVQAKVYALVHRGSYPRFLSSPLYKSLEQRLAAPTCDT
ncbi:regulator of G-protein signaling 19-like isoform X2 [Dermochelys coriacea]|uniref:regulator of G-protein signaling 19-like isoform X2 n=1 Tax=Dermochelys coriacea TaxID=27794 RepID=UPI0018E81965|nr:regulator of G-protein signaling 19-like isoform X2 [Dermochelys coriacea]